ncbi:hypothetical protein Tco_1336985 [Tanacetum coccineum]
MAQIMRMIEADAIGTWRLHQSDSSFANDPSIINDLGYKRFRGEKIDEEYERDCEIRIRKLKQDFNGEYGGQRSRKKEQAYSEEQFLLPGISDDTSDVPNCDNNRVNVEIDFVESLIDRDTSIVHSSKIDPILEEFAGDLAHIALISPEIVEANFDPNDDTSHDDDDFEDIEYVILEEVNNVDQEENFNSTPDRVLESPSPFPIPVVDSDAFFEESDTSLSHLDNSLPEFETFSNHTEETRSGSTTTHANYSLPEIYHNGIRANGMIRSCVCAISCFNFGDQFLYDKPTQDDQEKSKVREEFDSTIPDPNHQTVTSTPPVIAPFIDVSSTKLSSLVTPPPINTEATTITTSLPEITPFIALQLRVARLEQEMSEVKKTDHSADVLASIRSQVPTAVDKYLGTKLDDALLKNQESEKSPKEIIRIKREQGEEKQDSTYSIRSTDKVDLEEFDLKSALFKHMNKIKSANRNTANYHLYHALMEALIADEDAMDKEVADKVKDHKRKHDSDDDEDDDDDEGPSAGSNQGRSTKRRRSDSAASGSAQPPPKDDDQSSKKPRESDASATKQHPALTSTGWQITDTRDAGADSSMHRSDPESEHSEQSSDDIPMQDEGNDSDMEDTDNAHIPKVSTTTWFKPIPESERPATPEPEWTIPPNDFPEPENNWANTYATAYKVPEENKLQRKTYDIGSFIKWFCRRTGKKKLCKADLEGPAFNLVKAFHKNNVQPSCPSSATKAHSLVVWGERKSTSTNTVSPSDREADRIADANSSCEQCKETEMIKESDEADELTSLVWERLQRAWRLGSGQRMTREEAKTSSLQSREKDYDSKDLLSLESFVGRKNKRH